MSNIDYALETMREGVLIISKNGHITYANPAAKKIFDIYVENKALFWDILSEQSEKNDELVNMVINLITTGKSFERKTVNYYNNNNYKYYLNTSCTKTTDGEFVLTFSDQSDLILEMQKKNDLMVILITYFLIACVWTIGVSVWMRTGEKFPVGYLTIVMELIGIFTTYIITKKTSIKVTDLGLSFKNIKDTMIRTVKRLVILLAAMLLLKGVILIFFPQYFKEDYPFWDWSVADYRLINYIFTAFIQEFLARGGVQKLLSSILSGKQAKNHAIHLTAIFFMALHFQYGLPMMIGAGVLSILLGEMFKKDDNIYGVTVFHFCFGKIADFLHLI